MDREQLTTLLEIVREGSFSKAARSLDLTQPTISARIQALEAEVGGPLFVRGGRSLSLTEQGESFLPYARRSLDILNEGMEAVRQTQSGERGRVTLATFSSLAATILGETIARFHCRYPEASMRVCEGYHEEIIAMLEDGTIELGQVLWPHFLAGPHFQALACFREPLLFVASPEHPLARKSSMQMQDIAEQGRPFYHLGSGQVYRHIVAQIRALNLPTVDVPLSTSDRLLRQGIGVACYTRTLVTDDLIAGRLVELCITDAPADYRQIAFVRYRRKRPLSSAATNFIDEFRQTVARMDQEAIFEVPV